MSIAFTLLFRSDRGQCGRAHQGRAVLAVDPGFMSDSGNTFLAFCESRSSKDEVIVCDIGEASLDLATDTVVTA